ncbi:MAG: Na+/H+ antiporter NhaC [uncultured bacterium]|nr:MAG: Na+/H+ antiporter NhaC [uncultured bacterium]HLE76750.1 Na+/H+ antiporter NhaC family protein [Candidatus Babeliales bacterium]
MLNSWLTLLPPTFVIVGATITKRIHPALFLGIVSAAFIATQGDLWLTGTLSVNSLINTATSSDNLYLYAFLIAIGTLVSLFSATGAATSFAHAITKKIRSARQAQYSSLIVSLLLFIDDYLSILTTGYVMSPLIDRFHISRQKLAFLVHSMAGPIVILAPVSSWVATIINYLDQVGVTTNNEQGPIRIATDPFFIYLKTIPFIFYSFLTILSVWFIIKTNISFGPMRTYDEQATLKPQPPLPKETPTYTSNLLFPLVVLVLGIIIGLPLTGGFWLFGGEYGLIESLKYNEHPFLVMLIAALLAVFVGFARCYQRGLITVRQLPRIAYDGFDLMIGAIIMVYLASTFSGILANHVGTGQYLASLFIGSIPLWLLPTMFFLVSLACTIATGSAWGNFALMIPIAVPMITSLSGLPMPIDPQSLPLLLPVLGAIFSGSACGNHISPLSETTVMTATSTGIAPLTHAYTQFPYTLPAILSCIIGFTLLGILTMLTPTLSLLISFGVSSIFCLALLWWFNK